MDRQQAPEDVRQQAGMLPTIGTVRAILDDLANEADGVLDPDKPPPDGVVADPEFVVSRAALVARAAAIRIHELFPPELRPGQPPAELVILDGSDQPYLTLTADPGSPGDPCAIMDVSERMGYYSAEDCEQLAATFAALGRWLRHLEARPR